MQTPLRRLTVPSVALAALLLCAAAPAIWSRNDNKEELAFDVATVFFELNDTDGDLGIHALVDGEPWQNLSIRTPDGRENLRIRLESRLRRQGLTELFFESAEPTFDELSPRAFFRRFPEGNYEIEGTTIEGEEMESTSVVTHVMPAPAENITVNDMPVPEDCDEGPVPMVGEPFTIRWDPVIHSHPGIGRTGETIEVAKYELIVERKDPIPLKFSLDLPPDVTEVVLPAGLTGSGERIKVEVLVREAGGNQTAVESCFEVN